MGPVVPMIGGPLDGSEMHRSLSTGKHDRFVAYVAGHPTGKNCPVHVYEAHGSPTAPFRYIGIGSQIYGDSPYPITTYFTKRAAEVDGE